MEPENIHRKPIWDRISGKYPYFGGYFPPQGIRFCGLENIPPSKFEKQCHEYGLGSPNSQPMQAEAGFDARKGSFDTGSFVVYGTERGGLFLLEARGVTPLSRGVMERTAVTLSGSGAFCKAWTGSAQRTVKDGAGLPRGQVMSGFQRRMTCRTKVNAFCERVDVKIVYMHYLIIASGPVDRADQFHFLCFTILDIGVAAIGGIAQHYFRNQSSFLKVTAYGKDGRTIWFGRRLRDNRCDQLHITLQVSATCTWYPGPFRPS